MTDLDQKQLDKTLWNITDTLRGAMNADDFRDYMLSFLFLRYLSDNYEAAAKKELRRDYPNPNAIGNGGRTPSSSVRRPYVRPHMPGTQHQNTPHPSPLNVFHTPKAFHIVPPTRF
jgi:hypothetical protein